MNETHTTLVGNIATDVRTMTSRDGVRVTSFRIASTTRRFQNGKGWNDVDTLFVTVVCWRQLAEHTASSFAKGEPVIATGRLKVRQWTNDDGATRDALELEAYAVGHDLNRGTSAFRRADPRPLEQRPLRTAADELAAAVAREPIEPIEPIAPGAAEASGEPVEPVVAA